MVFDWFRRRTTPTEPPVEPAEVTEASDADATPASEPAPEPVTEPAPPAQPAAAAVDQDALDWARQAYARLKAEQERSQPTVEAQEPEATPQPVVAPAPEPEAVPAAEAPTPPSATAPEPSLLELAAASRAERQRTVLSPSPDLQAPISPGAPSVESQAPAASPLPASEEASPQLGSFDAEFTWSAEVLAAQGLRADQVSLEEIDWLSRLRRGLEKTRRGLVTQLLDTLGDDPLTPEVLDDLESSLLRADVGVTATDHVLEALRKRLNEEVVEPAEGLRFLKEQLRGLLEAPIEASGEPLLAPRRDRLNVWLLVGVNGVGKTTTLGKLANLAVRSGYSCLIAAADTFRAAAVQQVHRLGRAQRCARDCQPQRQRRSGCCGLRRHRRGPLQGHRTGAGGHGRSSADQAQPDGGAQQGAAHRRQAGS
jgi:fused signal recognition particle receptor